MAVEVVVTRTGTGRPDTVEDHPEGRYAYLVDGHLCISQTDGKEMRNCIAVYAPGQWKSFSQVASKG